MSENAKVDSRLARLADVAPAPLIGTRAQRLDRRHLTRRIALQRRICDEFREMPGTSLTVAQGARLFGVPGDICSRIFSELVRDGHLQQSNDRRYRLKSAA